MRTRHRYTLRGRVGSRHDHTVRVGMTALAAWVLVSVLGWTGVAAAIALAAS